MPGKFFLYRYNVGDVVVMKKKHPCGSKEWAVVTLGSDCKLKCQGCGHITEMGRETLEKSTVEVKKVEE